MMKRYLRVALAFPLLVAVIAFGETTASGAGGGAGANPPGLQRFDDAVLCSNWLASHGADSLPPELNERCIEAIATTYIDGEQNSIPPENILFASDVSRHRLGTPPSFQPGSRDALVQGYHAGSSASILSITDRHWVV